MGLTGAPDMLQMQCRSGSMDRWTPFDSMSGARRSRVSPTPRDARPRRRLEWRDRADVAQLARASPCHGEGRGFESLHPLHSVYAVPSCQGIVFLPCVVLASCLVCDPLSHRLVDDPVRRRSSVRDHVRRIRPPISASSTGQPARSGRAADACQAGGQSRKHRSRI